MQARHATEAPHAPQAKAPQAKAPQAAGAAMQAFMAQEADAIRLLEARTQRQRERQRAAAKKYYLANREAILARQKASRARDPSRRKDYEREYRKRNIEKIQNYARAYQRSNAERLAKYQRVYRAEHAAEMADYQRRYRAEHAVYERANRRKQAERN